MSNINKVKRASIKGSLTRFINHFNKVKDQQDVNLIDLRQRLIKAEELLAEFQEAQLIIESEDPDFDQNFETVHSLEREKFENDFFTIIAEVKLFLNNDSENAHSVDNVSVVRSDSFVRVSNNTTNIRLPQINLPTFDGSLDQWLFFRDCFTSIIHNNNQMSNVEKFHYLRLSVKGVAADKISSLQICDANYEVAWQLLHDRYENKQALIKNHVKGIFDLPALNKESHDGLVQLLDGLEKHINALNVLERPTDKWDDLIVYLMTTKFDNTTKRAWESRSESKKIPTIKTLKDFLEERCRILSSLTTSVSENKPDNKQASLKQFQSKQSKSFITTQNNQIYCILCKDNNHSLYKCSEFNKFSPKDRLNKAKQLRLCINCLKANHHTKDCKSSGCRQCGKIHHTLLHFGQFAPPKQDNSPKVNDSTPFSGFSTTHTQHSNTYNISSRSGSPSQILLSTAIVTVFDKHHKPHSCRVLLDSGSQVNFMTERLANILQLSKQEMNIAISGFNQIQRNVQYSITVLFKSNVNNFDKSITCIILPNITNYLPSISFDAKSWQIPPKINLADPNFDKPAPIDLLIGADTFWELLCIGQIKLGVGLPILQKSKLGWLISGAVFYQPPTFTSHHCCTSSINLENHLTKFWEIEDVPKKRFLSHEEASCEEHFKQTLSRHSDGCFIVSLPFKNSPSLLGDSLLTAKRRFFNLERKLKQNGSLRTSYHAFMAEYLQLGHMSLANDQNDTTGFFLPHHAVFKEDSTTTKLRVVFDGSSKSTSGLSLNEILMIGPNLQDNLFHILLRFRRHNYVLNADVAKMYRQVLVQPQDRNFQKILWRFHDDHPVNTYVLNTITYGTASAAYLAIRCLHEIAERHKDDFPDISQIILHDFYVDDLLTGTNTIEELKRIKDDISHLLLSYGFPLRKWISNTDKFLPSTDQHTLFIGDAEQSKTLGLRWDSKNDILQYSINMSKYSSKITKRQILSCTAQIFDPLGLLSPVTITAKIILQELWKLKISWDESIPSDLHTTWSKYHSELYQLNTLKIRRQVLCTISISTQLHGFCDASQTSYGACVYIRCCDELGNMTTQLYCAKTRVAPLKTISIPKLELSSALLLAELVDKVTHSSGIQFDSITYWTDSMICISWIKTSPHLLKTFVANRVSQIQTLSNPNSWKHVSSQDNPADLLSRGLTPSELINSDMWFHGPVWLLTNESFWPSYNSNSECVALSDLPETRNKIAMLAQATSNFEKRMNDVMMKFSSLITLQRVFAFVLRYINNTKDKKSRTVGPLSPKELENSLFTLIRLVQRYMFPEDYIRLSVSRPVSRKSKLLNLNPFLDHSKGVIRVGGRLQHSSFDFNKKHPVILPTKHHFTVILARYEHIRLLHAGPQALLASLRERFWPLSGRNLSRRIVHDCVRCFRFTAKPNTYLMGNLPSARLTPSRPFFVCGVDYAGPFLLRDRKGRNFKTTKAYISLFVCLTTKAIHLEIVTDLTSECFLAALRRFMSRRGKCREIYSDNSTTFVGANKEIYSFLKTHNDEIEDDLSKEGIAWNFIIPHAPHYGGIWESGVKSTKYHLKRVVGNALLTYEEFYTTLCQIEACLNSRPLYPMSNDPNDLNSLTPAHFLIGESLNTIPECSLVDLHERRLSHFQRMQQMVQNFWARWSKEYVSNLQVRTKWKEHHEQLLKVGTLVLIKEDGLPPLRWRLGRIIKLHRAADNIVRSVLLKTSTGELKRPVMKVCVLPSQ